MKKVLAVLLAVIMVLSLSGCTTEGTLLGVLSQLGSQSESQSEKPTDMPGTQAQPTETETEPAPQRDEALVANFEGDWHGWAHWYNGTGSTAPADGGQNFELIARFVFDEAGALTPYLAVAIDNRDFDFKDYQAVPQNSNTLNIEGKFFKLPLKDTTLVANGNGSLSLQLFAEDSAKGDSAQIVATFRKVFDTTWNPAIDMPCFPDEYVNYYADKSFDDIARSYGLDLNDIPKANASSDTPSQGSELTGNVTTVDVDIMGRVQISFPEGWSWDNGYNWIRKADGTMHIGVDTLLGSSNVQEWRESFTGDSYKSYDSYKFEEVTFGGYKGIRCQYEDWLGATVNLVLDFGDKAGNGIYGVKFTMSGDKLSDLWTDEIQAILKTITVK